MIDSTLSSSSVTLVYFIPRTGVLAIMVASALLVLFAAVQAYAQQSAWGQCKLTPLKCIDMC